MERPVRPPKDGALLSFLYRSPAGRVLLKGCCAPAVSRLCGAFLDHPLSAGLIATFCKRYGISPEEYEPEKFRCFNDFFCRRPSVGSRPANPDPVALIAPCDGLLSAYRLAGTQVIPVKQSRFTLEALLAGNPCFREFQDGICLVFRLCVNHFHRYIYMDDGRKGANHFIKGRLHTVRPIALETVPVFAENCREYTVIRTEHFGTVIQMEVGAMLVGRILNYHGAGRVRRGTEKGRFLYGGSTVILLLQKGAAQLPEQIFEGTKRGLETPVKMGERIGTAASAQGER